MPRSLGLLSAVLLSSIGWSVLAAQGHRTIDEEYLKSMVSEMGCIIRGQVTSVQPMRIDYREIIGGDQSAKLGNIIVTEVSLTVEEVLAGDCDEKTVKIILREGKIGQEAYRSGQFTPMTVDAGDDAVVGIPPRLEGVNLDILQDRKAFFKVAGDNLIPYQEEFRMAVAKPLDLIRQEAKKREFSQLFKSADLVVAGTVTRLMSPPDPRQMVVSIDETFKGMSAQNVITVSLRGIIQPLGQKPGYNVMLFLNKHDSEYHLVDGANGYYAIAGDSVQRGHNLPMHVTAGHLKGQIRSWKEAER